MVFCFKPDLRQNVMEFQLDSWTVGQNFEFYIRYALMQKYPYEIVYSEFEIGNSIFR
jgi:hypothetical protein